MVYFFYTPEPGGQCAARSRRALRARGPDPPDVHGRSRPRPGGALGGHDPESGTRREPDGSGWGGFVERRCEGAAPWRGPWAGPSSTPSRASCGPSSAQPWPCRGPAAPYVCRAWAWKASRRAERQTTGAIGYSITTNRTRQGREVPLVRVTSSPSCAFPGFLLDPPHPPSASVRSLHFEATLPLTTSSPVGDMDAAPGSPPALASLRDLRQISRQSCRAPHLRLRTPLPGARTTRTSLNLFCAPLCPTPTHSPPRYPKGEGVEILNFRAGPSDNRRPTVLLAVGAPSGRPPPRDSWPRPDTAPIVRRRLFGWGSASAFRQ